jgi:hypothetical protein
MKAALQQSNALNNSVEALLRAMKEELWFALVLPLGALPKTAP